MKGFTLAELLVALTLSAILLVSVSAVFAQSVETVTLAEARADLYAQARHAVSRMQTDLLGCLKSPAFEKNKISFRALADRRGEIGTFEIEYRLRPEARGLRSGRPLHVLQRRVRQSNGETSDEEAAQGVTSFAVEAFDSCLRVTLAIVDGAGERQERTIVREFWIPGGSR